MPRHQRVQNSKVRNWFPLLARVRRMGPRAAMVCCAGVEGSWESYPLGKQQSQIYGIHQHPGYVCKTLQNQFLKE